MSSPRSVSIGLAAALEIMRMPAAAWTSEAGIAAPEHGLPATTTTAHRDQLVAAQLYRLGAEPAYTGLTPRCRRAPRQSSSSAPSARRQRQRAAQPEFDTLLGRIGSDQKGDVTGYETFVWYQWQGDSWPRRGGRHPLQRQAAGAACKAVFDPALGNQPQDTIGRKAADC